MLESVKAQSVKPDSIRVNLSTEPYLWDKGIDDVPEWLLDSAYELEWVPNTGPYRKLIPTINHCEEGDTVVTADDDVVYHHGWLAELVATARENPHAVVCGRGRRIRRNVFGQWQNYGRWHLVSSAAQGLDLLPTGSGGCGYRPELLDLDFLNDTEATRLAPTADDLWFRLAAIRKGTPVRLAPQINRENAFLSHTGGLEEFNLKKGNATVKKGGIRRVTIAIRDWAGVPRTENDRAWRRIIAYGSNQTVHDAL